MDARVEVAVHQQPFQRVVARQQRIGAQQCLARLVVASIRQLRHCLLLQHPVDVHHHGGRAVIRAAGDRTRQAQPVAKAGQAQE